MVSQGGRNEPYVTRIYSGMIYFDDLDPPENPAGVDKLIEECQWDYEYGYRQFKVKIGRGNRWMKPASAGMQRDILAVQEIHKAFPDCDILVDGRKIANQRVTRSSPARFYDVEYAINANMIKDKEKVTIRFEAPEGNVVAAIFGIRMIRADAER